MLSHKSTRTGTRNGALGGARAFTLIEVLVVVAIIALLISILLPSLKQARDVSKRSVCASNLHQQLLGMRSYAADYQGSMPWRGWFSYSIAESGHEGYGLGGANKDRKFLVNLGLLMGKHLGHTSPPVRDKKPGKEWDVLYCPSTKSKYQSGAGGLPSLWDPAHPWTYGGYNYALPMGSRVGGPKLNQEVYPHDKLDGRWVRYLEKRLKDMNAGPDADPLELMPTNGLHPLVIDWVIGGVKGPHNSGINVSYSDGHVRFINHKELKGGTSGSTDSFALWYYCMLRP